MPSIRRLNGTNLIESANVVRPMSRVPVSPKIGAERKLVYEALSRARENLTSRIASTSSSLRDLGIGGRYHAPEFAGIAVWLSSGIAHFAWGPWRTRMGAAPYKTYFPNLAPKDDERPLPASTVPSIPAGGNTKIGDVSLQIVGVRGTSRFGGTVEVTLVPTEDFGIEFFDTAAQIALDALAWTVRLYIRPSANWFTAAAASPSFANGLSGSIHVEIDVNAADAYVLQGGKLSFSPCTDQAKVTKLLSDAETELEAMLQPVARFVVGFLHEQKLPTLTGADKVVAVQISDCGIHFETGKFEPWIAMYVRSQFFGTDDLDTFGAEELEVEMQLMAKRGPPGSETLVDVAFREVDLGNTTSTPQVRLMDMPLAKFKEVQRITVYLRCFEQDFDAFGERFNFLHPLGSFWNFGQVESDAASGKWGIFAVSPSDLQAAESSAADVCAATQVELRLYPR